MECSRCDHDGTINSFDVSISSLPIRHSPICAVAGRLYTDPFPIDAYTALKRGLLNLPLYTLALLQWTRKWRIPSRVATKLLTLLWF
jgi:hypothetical protein